MAILRKSDGYYATYTLDDLGVRVAEEDGRGYCGVTPLDELIRERDYQRANGFPDAVWSTIPCDSLEEAQEIELDVYGVDADFEPFDVRGEPVDGY